MDEAETTILWNRHALRHALSIVGLDWHWLKRNSSIGMLIASHPTAQMPE
jgi:hypothetical protein